jgi:hypothetical protein
MLTFRYQFGIASAHIASVLQNLDGRCNGNPWRASSYFKQR